MHKQYEMSTTPVLNDSHVVTERRRKRGGKNTRVSVITDFGHSLNDGSGERPAGWVGGPRVFVIMTGHDSSFAFL